MWKAHFGLKVEVENDPFPAVDYITLMKYMKEAPNKNASQKESLNHKLSSL